MKNQLLLHLQDQDGFKDKKAQGLCASVQKQTAGVILKLFSLIMLVSVFFATMCGGAAAAEKINVTPFCFADSDTGQLVVFTMLTMNFKKNQKATPDWNPKEISREILKIDCSLGLSKCNASIIKPENIENEQPLSSLDVILPDISLVSRNQKVFTFALGPFVTITVDIPAGRVLWSDSSPAGEGRGIGYCK